MNSPAADGPGLTWLAFALLTVCCWGLYGVFLHSGQAAMGDAATARYKAFLFVGIAYFLTAILAPVLILLAKGATWQFPMRGMAWSLVAGLVGAAGAFFVLLAFGAKGMPSVVMSIVFAGAPIVNAVVALALHPPAGGWAGLRRQFFAGIHAGGARRLPGDALQTRPEPREKRRQAADRTTRPEAISRGKVWSISLQGISKTLKRSTPNTKEAR